MKNKAFTLLELLAVIIILAVIALITTPAVLNVIENAKKESNKDSAYGLIDAVELYYSESLLDGSKKENLNGTTNLIDKIKISGKKPDSGYIYVNGIGKTALAVVYDNVCYKKNFTETDLTESEDIENCNINVEVSYKCKRATTLHTETCTQTDSKRYCGVAGYTETGSKGTTTITYGNETITPEQLNPGDAFDCDVNGDETYDSATERFYYISDLESNSKYAVLVYYNNTTNGVADNTSSSLIVYDSSDENWHGPVTAITNLPTTTQWTNVSLSSTTRAIINQNGGTTTNGGTLPTEFSYSKVVDGETVPLAARLLTAQEINDACGITVGSSTKGELDGCNYLMENTKYSSSSMGTYGYWLETPNASNSSSVWSVSGNNRSVNKYNANSTSSRGVRPVIEVLKTDIQY